MDGYVPSNPSNPGFCDWRSQRENLSAFMATFPIAYRSCLAYSDFWNAYQKVNPADQHFAVGKDSGEANHMERWYGTMRQLTSLTS